MSFRRRLRSLHDPDVDTRTALMAMIDVVFLLMIFFLFGSTGFVDQQLLASLPTPASQPPSPSKSSSWLTLRLGEAGGVEYRIDGGDWSDRIDQAESRLSAALSSLASNGRAVVDCLPGVSFQSIVDALALAQRCGASGISLRTD